MPQYEDYINWRRTFHQYPELSDAEYETTKRIKRILASYDIKVLDLPLETGLVAEVDKVINSLQLEQILMHYQ